MIQFKKLAVLAATLAFVLTGCSNGTSSSTAKTNAETITIEHAFGSVEVPKNPERIVTIAWENNDTPLALGVAPVGTSAANYGEVTENNLHPWADEKFKELNVEPNVFDDTDGLDFEAIADANPDVILASYSGITEEDYKTLSEIAPVVAYKDQPWQTLWRDQTIENAAGMGKEEEGKKLVEEVDALIQEKLEQYPNLKGINTAFMWITPGDLSSFYVYTPKDPRAAFLTDLGLTFPESVNSLSEDAQAFSVTVSRENSDQLSDVDMIVVYGNQELLDELQKDELMSQIPAVKNGAVVLIDESSALAGGATPSVLSIPYNIDTYLELLNEAATKIQ